MLGDVLLIDDKHLSAAADIYNKIKTERKGRYILAISGESGSGKTELAHCINKNFKADGVRAKCMHIDNYYRIHPLQRTKWRKEKWS